MAPTTGNELLATLLGRLMRESAHAGAVGWAVQQDIRQGLVFSDWRKVESIVYWARQAAHAAREAERCRELILAHYVKTKDVELHKLLASGIADLIGGKD